MVAAVTGILGINSSVSFSQNAKKPFITEGDLHTRIYTMVSGIYEDAKNFGIPLKENYVEDISKAVFPDARFISERRFTVGK
jgi:hypothetical protein